MHVIFEGNLTIYWFFICETERVLSILMTLTIEGIPFLGVERYQKQYYIHSYYSIVGNLLLKLKIINLNEVIKYKFNRVLQGSSLGPILFPLTLKL